MSDQRQEQQLPPIYDAEEPSEESQRIDAIFDDLETKQPDTLDEAGKGLIERIATFLGVLFGVTVLSNNFPPAYLKDNTTAKVIIIISLVCFLCSIAAATWGIQVRYYRRYTNNVTESGKQLKRMLKRKLFWLRVAYILFALGAIALAVLLIVIVWSL
jgi:hypothetical protein